MTLKKKKPYLSANPSIHPRDDGHALRYPFSHGIDDQDARGRTVGCQMVRCVLGQRLPECATAAAADKRWRSCACATQVEGGCPADQAGSGNTGPADQASGKTGTAEGSKRRAADGERFDLPKFEMRPLGWNHHIRRKENCDTPVYGGKIPSWKHWKKD